MAITKNDCVLLLTELKEQYGINVSAELTKLIKADNIIDTLAFINSNRELNVTSFYKKIRKSYNQHHNKLYINIMKEIEDPVEVISTLSAMLTQIALFSKNLENKQQFFKHSRADEICKVLSNYYKTFDITHAIKLMRIIKADIKALESM